ncbi:MAG: hypothetical protein AB1898_13565 [Acidobacteriota bacterium]
MSLQNELLNLVRSQEIQFNGELNERTSLIKSGLLNSLALFNLATWIEEHVGPAVDLTSFDVTREWDTVEDILCFVQKHRQNR